MAFPYKHVVLIGATSGVGKGMAESLVESGVKVTAVGRRQDRLNEFVNKYGKDKADGAVFDIAEYQKAQQFAADIMEKSRDIDCLFLNAGIQRNWDLAELENIDLEEFNSEMTINYTSFVALVQAFLPYLKNQKPASIIFTGSNIAIVPASTLPNYSASKTALNVFTLCLREQLKVAGSHVKVIEISGPPVQTELHDYMGAETGRKMGMPLEDFTKLVMDGFYAGHDQIVIGSILDPTTFNEIVNKRRTAFEKLAEIIRVATKTHKG
ncbi:oxidoreductase [Mollisia scopiformis]|uniref:Oxidoreductase n=1 Tax=Mollisia scopiformis TaxID=149040 RepID=A0A194X2A9_MOLSC|nr:oxidoreductase [Mollisia scopiformis]KUJ13967.1 oxidoreductase [Mollisia scopiformis]